MNNVIEKINENTWRIEDQYVRFFLLTGNEKAMMIDSGIMTPNAKEIAQSLTDLPIILLNTHGDRDHISGTGAFSEIYMTSEDYVNCKVGESFPESKCLPLKDGDVIDLGGRKLEIIAIPGHTYGSVAILDAENRALFSGDTVQSGNIFMFGPHRSPADFAGSLEKLMQMEKRFDVIYPSHAAPVLPAEYVKKVAEAWTKVCAGEVTPYVENLHGMDVHTYVTEDCGFYCDMK